MATAEGYDGKYIQGQWISDHCLKLVLNRPKVNAFNTEHWRELGEHFRRVRHDTKCYSVVLCSGQKLFTAGLDLMAGDLVSYRGEDTARTALLLREHILEFQSAISAIQDCDRPVIVAVHGVCYGLGIDIISACDVRLVATDCRFSIKEVDAGIAADIGTLQRLPRATGNDSLLRELAFTSRDFGAEEAVALGLASRGQIVQGGQKEVIAKAEEMGRAIATKSPVATRGTKHLLNFSQDHTIREGLEYSALWNAAALQSEDTPTAMAAVLNKSEPEFKPMSKL